MERKRRAVLLDEGLEIIERLWRGQTDFVGEEYVLDMADEPPRDLRPVQEPRIPIWVVGAWKRGPSMRRAARYDGVIPMVMDQTADRFGPSFEQMAAWVRAHPHDDGATAEVIWEAETPADEPDEATAKVTRWRDRGATWWLESRWGQGGEEIRRRIDAGPPRPTS